MCYFIKLKTITGYADKIHLLHFPMGKEKIVDNCSGPLAFFANFVYGKDLYNQIATMSCKIVKTLPICYLLVGVEARLFIYASEQVP